MDACVDVALGSYEQINNAAYKKWVGEDLSRREAYLAAPLMGVWIRVACNVKLL